MKTLRPLIILFLACFIKTQAQTASDYFVTVWDLSFEGVSSTELRFYVETVGQ
ncbi:MAG: hypothetical protein SNJ77_05535 [Cytophagales bacterium]